MFRHRAVKRAVLVLGGILAAIVMLEILLQAGAVYFAATGREAPVSVATGDYRILCLGDSNTYGLYLKREEAYPQQLEVLWNQSGRLPKGKVFNLGFPGTNSSKLLSQFPDMLDTFQPDLVIIMVGVNDFWTSPVSFEAPRDLRYRARWFLQRHSRAYKLFYMLRRRSEMAELEVVKNNPDGVRMMGSGTARFGGREFALGWKKAVQGELGLHSLQDLEDNISTLSDYARDFGAELILMTYASRYKAYPVANKIIRKAAARTGRPLVDLTAVFERICPREECPEMLFPDHHPRAAGHRVIAKTIVGTRLAELGLEQEEQMSEVP